MTLTDREFATVLAALRYWQEHEAPNAHAPEFPDGHGYGSFFAEHEPLTEAEIDDLCERIDVIDAAKRAEIRLALIIRSLRDDCGVEAWAHYPGGIAVTVDKGRYVFGTANGPWQGDYLESTAPEGTVVNHVLTLALDPTTEDPTVIAAAIASALTVGLPTGEGVSDSDGADSPLTPVRVDDAVVVAKARAILAASNQPVTDSDAAAERDLAAFDALVALLTEPGAPVTEDTRR